MAAQRMVFQPVRLTGPDRAGRLVGGDRSEIMAALSDITHRHSLRCTLFAVCADGRPGLQILAKLIYPIDKSDLDPLRLLHFLAIAILVARFVGPDWKGLTTPILRSVIRCGEKALEIYCVGVLLSLAADVVLVKVSDGLAMQGRPEPGRGGCHDRHRDLAAKDQDRKSGRTETVSKMVAEPTIVPL
jgi:OpgC protein